MVKQILVFDNSLILLLNSQNRAIFEKATVKWYLSQIEFCFIAKSMQLRTNLIVNLNATCFTGSWTRPAIRGYFDISDNWIIFIYFKLNT